MASDMRIGFSIIPNEVKYNRDLRLLSRFVLSDIVSFTYAFECFASNDYFAELYGVSKRTIETVIKELRDHEYIVTQYNPGTNRRIITPSINIMNCFLRVRETDIILEEKKQTERQRSEYKEKFRQTTKGVAISELKKIWS